jgi:hyaluronoglucosaminidase
VGAFRHGGVIEGFYGPPWSHSDRLWMLERLGDWGLNRYVHAPKNDPLQRDRWREPYPDDQLAQFAQLIRVGEQAGVCVGFALSPGLSIRYSSEEDREALLAKFRGFVALGARFLALTLDDVPSAPVHEEDRRAFGTLGAAHVALANELASAVGSDVTLYVCPTDYTGVEASEYLERLGRELAPAIEVGWTGRTVVPPTITAAEAAARAATLRRPPLIWDNVPVSDGPMRTMAHLGPFGGREPGLRDHVSGLLLNPMEHAHASAIALHTFAAYFRDPDGYEPERAWQAAIDELAAGAAASFRIFAQAHRFSPLWPDARDSELEAAIDELRAALDAGATTDAALGTLRARLGEREPAAAAVREQLSDRQLAQELDPWLESHERETRRMQAAVEALAALAADGPVGTHALAFMRFEGLLTLRPPGERTSYGPRRVLYPQLTSMREEEMRFGADPALIRDRCLADELIRLVEQRALQVLAG